MERTLSTEELCVLLKVSFCTNTLLRLKDFSLGTRDTDPHVCALPAGCGAGIGGSPAPRQWSAPASAPVVLEQMLVSGEQPGPGMWKVSKGDNTLWIIGTQTPVPEKMKWRAKGLEAIVAQSQEILTGPGHRFRSSRSAISPRCSCCLQLCRYEKIRMMRH